MKNVLAALDRARKRFRIAQVAGYQFDVELVDFAARTAQGADPMAAFDQQTRHVPAKKTTGPGN